jgi:hypothetical protein
MNEKIFEALTALANKLGTTAEMLWASLIRQARIALIADILTVALTVISAFWCLRVYRKYDGLWGASEHRSSDWDEHPAVAISLGIWACVTVIFVIICVASLPGIFAEAFNPEYWAFKEILSAFASH